MSRHFEVLGRYEGFDALAGVLWTPRDGGERSVRVDELPVPLSGIPNRVTAIAQSAMLAFGVNYRGGNP